MARRSHSIQNPSTAELLSLGARDGIQANGEHSSLGESASRMGSQWRSTTLDDEQSDPLDLAASDELLHYLDGDLLYLLRRAEVVKKKRDVLLARDAPMNQLPVEILARVFELGSYNDLAFSYTADLVCQRWHKLARKLPSIWGNIILDAKWMHGTRSFHSKMSLCLVRSVESPLLVHFDLCVIDTIEEARALLAAIAPHIARCYSFSIVVPHPEWIELIGQCFGGSLAAKMESMSLRFKPISPWAAAYVQSTILQGAMPLLHTLILEGLPLTVVNVSLPGLRSFHYKQFEEMYSYPQNAAAVMPMSDLWHTLRQAPEIEELSVEYSSFSMAEEDIISTTDTKVALPHLKSLTIGHVDAGFAHVLMEVIDAPSLGKLLIRYDHLRNQQDVWWIPNHRVVHLLSLVLDGVRILDGSPMISLTRLFSSAKKIRKLSIRTPMTIVTHTTATPQLFVALSRPTPGGEWLCPELTEFTIAGCNLITGHELLQFVRAREESRAVPSIQFLGIKECAAFEVTVMGELERCVPTVFYLPPQAPPAIPSSPAHWDQGSFYP